MRRKINIANFNLTFGVDEEPMLSHFDDIVYPAFTSGIKNESFNEYERSIFLHNVKVENDHLDDYMLTGLIVKKTILEIKSQIEGNELIDTDYEYPTAPYSYFCINLKNHRMYLVKNQNGSPDIRTFQSTVLYILKEYVANKNKGILDELDKLPNPYLKIIGVPFKANINEELKKVEKISSLTFKFFPLNGDTDFSESFENISLLRKDLDSKTGQVTYNSPKNINYVADLLEQTRGTVDPVLKVKYASGDKESTITADKLSEKINIEMDDEGLKEKNISKIQRTMRKSETLNDLKGNHSEIFEKYKNKILKYLK